MKTLGQQRRRLHTRVRREGTKTKRSSQALELIETLLAADWNG